MAAVHEAFREVGPEEIVSFDEREALIVVGAALGNGVPRIVKLNDTGDLSALRPARSSGRRLRG